MDVKFYIAKFSDGKLLYANFPDKLLSWVEAKETADKFNLNDGKSYVKGIRKNYVDEEIFMILVY